MHSLNETASAFMVLRDFVCPSQRLALADLCKGEEAQYFRALVIKYAERVKTMPQTYQSRGEEALAFLHYFHGGCDWYISERDGTPEQLQAFGMAHIHESELGYISIRELIGAGVELDLHWEPKPLNQCKRVERV